MRVNNGADTARCCRSWLLVLWTLAAVVWTASSARPPPTIGTCVVSEPVYFVFECQLAAFGGYLPHSPPADAPVAVTFAQDADMFACSPQQPSNPESKVVSAYHDAIVIVRRGQCAFQDKLAQLMASSSDIGKPHTMVLINSEDKLLQLGGLTYDGALSSAFAVSVKKSDGEKLLQLVQQQHDHGSVVKLSITSSLPRMRQALQRIQHLFFTNFPLIAYETYMNEIPPVTRNFDALLRNLNVKPSMAAASLPLHHEWIEFFHQCALAFPSQWEFTSSVSLHAAVSAASLLGSYQPSELDNSAPIAEIWQLAAHKLAEAGYYSQAQFCLQQIQKKSPALDQAAQCQLAFVNFLQGDIVKSVPTAKHCLESLNVGVNISARSLNVAHELLVRLAGLDMSNDDLQCLHQATYRPKSTEQQQQPMVKCCQRHALPSRDEISKQPRKRHKQFVFHSVFVKELFHSLTIMGVFLDELGAFNESLTFFQHASQLCPDDVSLQLRQILAVPIVFGSSEEITEFYTTLEAKVSALTMAANKKNSRVKELILSSITGSAYAEERLHMRPEEATYLQYTITPPTMFVGYQGIDVLPVQRAINELRKVVYPSLQSIESPKPFPITESAGGNNSPPLESSRKRRVAFISTWFRNHSVGKLLLGVVQRLDRAKFHVLIYRCVHFLRDSDELTNQFRSVADTFVDLPVNHEDALALLNHDAIDVVVYPELGMDEWLVLLSHHRIAPVQCVFWGHPITTGNPAIDFFISSEYFVSDFFEHDAESTTTMANDAEPFRYHGSVFSEQIVLFRGLSTFFTRYICMPYLTLGVHCLYAAVAGEDEYAAHAQHAASTREPPVVPLSPDFDTVIAGILSQDPEAYIVLLASETQEVWKEQLRRRFRSSLGGANDALRRVLFVSTLPYAEFMALLSFADVILDPFPFGGGVTTLDALALGVPVVTLPKAQTVMQLASGFLRYMNATRTIAKSVDEFVSIAIAVATNADGLRTELRDELLLRHTVVYDDAASVDDWNAFLAHVTD